MEKIKYGKVFFEEKNTNSKKDKKNLFGISKVKTIVKVKIFFLVRHNRT